MAEGDEEHEKGGKKMRNGYEWMDVAEAESCGGKAGNRIQEKAKSDELKTLEFWI